MVVSDCSFSIKPEQTAQTSGNLQTYTTMEECVTECARDGSCRAAQFRLNPVQCFHFTSTQSLGPNSQFVHYVKEQCFGSGDNDTGRTGYILRTSNC